MAYNKEYYAEKKKKLIEKNQKETQRFLADTMDFVDTIKGIDADFQEIAKTEMEAIANEQKAKTPEEVVAQTPTQKGKK